MDNNKYYRSNLAHDFSLFENGPIKSETVINIPQAQLNSRKKKSKTEKMPLLTKLFYAVTAVTIVISIAFSIIAQAEIYKTSRKIYWTEQEGVELKSEAKTLKVEYVKVTETRNIRKKALEAGMKPVEKKQITYIFENED